MSATILHSTREVTITSFGFRGKAETLSVEFLTTTTADTALGDGKKETISVPLRDINQIFFSATREDSTNGDTLECFYSGGNRLIMNCTPAHLAHQAFFSIEDHIVDRENNYITLCNTTECAVEPGALSVFSTMVAVSAIAAVCLEVNNSDDTTSHVVVLTSDSTIITAKRGPSKSALEIFTDINRRLLRLRTIPVPLDSQSLTLVLVFDHIKTISLEMDNGRPGVTIVTAGSHTFRLRGCADAQYRYFTALSCELFGI